MGVSGDVPGAGWMTKLEKLLILHEGLVLKKYRCPKGKLTVGVGHNLDARPIPDLPDEITKTQAMNILLGDLADTQDAIRARLPWTEELDEVRHAVLTDMCFNLGLSGLMNFGNTLGEVKRGNWQRASEAMGASRWASQVGTRATRLQRMMVEGLWPEELERVSG